MLSSSIIHNNEYSSYYQIQLTPSHLLGSLSPLAKSVLHEIQWNSCRPTCNYSRLPLIRHFQDFSDAKLPEITDDWVIFSVIAEHTLLKNEIHRFYKMILIVRREDHFLKQEWFLLKNYVLPYWY